MAHVEAGLRSGDFRQPFPEEMNRVLASQLATLHFAATDEAAENLLREGVAPDRIFGDRQHGNRCGAGDSRRPASGGLWAEGVPSIDAGKKLILVTAHRRESFGEGFVDICEALLRLAARPRRRDCLSGASES